MPALPALLIIDVQHAIDDPRWAADGPRNNPEAELRIAELLAAWRLRRAPVFHVRHDSVEPGSAYAPSAPSHGFKPCAEPAPGEAVIAKQTNSAFIGTDLDPILRGLGVERLVVCGVITNNSVEATVRMAGNLGFDTMLAEDACFTFARRDWAGVVRSAQEVHDMSLANLDGEYCRVTTTVQILAELG